MANKTPKIQSGVKAAKLDKWLPWLLIILGAIGTLCAFIIMYEKLHILQNPNYRPSCSINPIISCGSVMQSDQSNAFGFPNPLIGLAGFPVLVTVGVTMLAGARFKRWFWLAVQAGSLFALGFVHWLFFQSTYSINALCPYCIVVWIVTIALFWHIFLYNLRQGHLKLNFLNVRVKDFIQRHHGDILFTWYLVITVLILHHFWYYFKTLL